MERRPSEVLLDVVQILEDLRIGYVIGGSWASAAYGALRFTRDADLVIDLRADQVETLAQRLEPEFYVSRDAMKESLRSRSFFNAVHLDTGFKFDFFVLGAGAFDQEEFRRRVARPLEGAGGPTLVFKTPEDTILRKLESFRRGGEVSELQWNDVLRVMEALRGQLDEGQLKRWAEALGVIDLLDRARRHATKS